MAVPFVDLSFIHAPIRDRVMAAITEVVESERFILGPGVAAFEREIAAFLDVGHAVGVSSGTDALLVAMMGLDVGPGDEVITTPYTFFATGGAVARLGARPVFVDIEPGSFNLAPQAVEDAIGPKTKAVIAVHLFGRAADMTALQTIGGRHGIPIIEDAAQAIGAEWEGRRVGSIGRVGCFSFFPAKNLGCFGDGGLVTTPDAELAARIQRLRKHGGAKQYHHDEVGGNFRLDALQAAILRVKLPELEGWTTLRQDHAFGYDQRFSGAGLLDGRVILPQPGPGRAVWNQYVVRVPGGRRDAVLSALREADIGCAVYYPVPLHLQPCFAAHGARRGDCPVAEQAAEETLALPVAPGLTGAQQDEVVGTIARVLSA